jgi:hypothetical protein
MGVSREKATAGLAVFGEDRGTLWIDPGSPSVPLSEFQKNGAWKRNLKRRLGKRPLIWFVDDERANRDWFVENHSHHFALLTFNARTHLLSALRSGTLCDAVVTDVFFPASTPADDAQANELLRIYDEMGRSTVSGLPNVWNRHKQAWMLDGFSIARDVFDHAVKRNERIPVLLFSRKATLLFNSGEWLFEPAATRLRTPIGCSKSSIHVTLV